MGSGDRCKYRTIKFLNHRIKRPAENTPDRARQYSGLSSRIFRVPDNRPLTKAVIGSKTDLAIEAVAQKSGGVFSGNSHLAEVHLNASDQLFIMLKLFSSALNYKEINNSIFSKHISREKRIKL